MSLSLLVITSHASIYYIRRPCRARARLYRFVIRRGIKLTPLMLPNVQMDRIRVVVCTIVIFLKGDTILRVSGPSIYPRDRACVSVLVFPFSPSFCTTLYFRTFAPPTSKSMRSTTQTLGRFGRALMLTFFRYSINNNFIQFTQITSIDNNNIIITSPYHKNA